MSRISKWWRGLDPVDSSMIAMGIPVLVLCLLLVARNHRIESGRALAASSPIFTAGHFYSQHKSEDGLLAATMYSLGGKPVGCEVYHRQGRFDCDGAGVGIKLVLSVKGTVAFSEEVQSLTPHRVNYNDTVTLDIRHDDELRKSTVSWQMGNFPLANGQKTFPRVMEIVIEEHPDSR